MNLATRCNACDTVFRVVRDQLRISDGWVRCGRCQAVFNASDDLFELDDAGPDLSAGADAAGERARHVIDEMAADRRRWQAESASLPVTWATRAAEGLDDVVAPADPATYPGPYEPRPGDGEHPVDVGTGPAPAAGAWAPDDDQTAAEAAPAADPPPIDDDRPAAIVQWQSSPPPLSALDEAPPAGESPAPIPAIAADPDAAPQPRFVRRADRAAFWRRRPVRAAVGAAALLLTLALAAQIGHAARDRLAAQWPALAPALQTLCSLTGCHVAPLQQIDRLSVESAGLTLLEDAPLYRLAVVLRNRADTALALPALELSLEDAQGALVARRVLHGADLGLATPVIEAGAQLPLTVTLAARDRRIAGYHVELFYP